MTRARDIANLVDANGDIVAGALDNVPAADVVNDTTPQLGGNLDAQSNNITSVGNLGIGTASPAGLVDVHNASGDANMFITTGTTNGSTTLLFGDSLNSTRGRVQYDHSNDSMRFQTASSERMRIDSSGRVGVNTTSPSSYISARGIAIRGVNQAGMPTYSGQDASDTTGYLNMYADQNNGYKRYFDIGMVGAASGKGGNMRFLTYPDSATSARVGMEIDQSGRVTLPYQPAFEVTSPNAVAAGNYMSYTSVTTNRGNHWNSSTNAFVAPVSGFYCFTFHQFTDRTSATGDTFWDVVVNGGFRNRLYQAKDGSASTHMQVNAAFGLYLNANDSLSMYYSTGVANSTGGSNHNKFSGFLVG